LPLEHTPLQLLSDIFFFQAEDGIRDRNVTGVQTCALLVDRGAAELSAGDRETTVASRELMVLPDGARRLEIRAADGEDFRAMLLGGEPLGEGILMWWNFVGRTHEEIVACRARHPAQV